MSLDRLIAIRALEIVLKEGLSFEGAIILARRERHLNNHKDNTFDEYVSNAKAYSCSLCGGYDPRGPEPYSNWPIRIGVLMGHNKDCPRWTKLSNNNHKEVSHATSSDNAPCDHDDSRLQ